MDRKKFYKIYMAFTSQHDDELLWLIEKVEKLNPEIILEIGIGPGTSFTFWNEILREDGLLIGIDKAPSAIQLQEKRLKLREPIYTYVPKKRNNYKLILGDSVAPKTVQQVKDVLKGRQIDFIFDDSSYHQKDREIYSPFLKKGGIMAFHDIDTYQKAPWIRLKGKKESLIVCTGIGVWYKE